MPAPPSRAAASGVGQPRTEGSPEGTFLFVLPWDLGAIGGVSQVVRALISELGQTGLLEPALLVNSWEDARPRSSTEGGFRRTFLRVPSPLGETGASAVHGLKYALTLPWRLAALRAFARGNLVRVVNIHFPTPSALTWFLARAIGGPRYRIVLSLHGLEVRSTFGMRNMERRLWSWMLRRADHVIACSDGLRDEVTREYGLPHGRVTTIHNGIDPAHIERTRDSAPPRAPLPRPYLCNVGTFEPKKAHDVLLRAFSAFVSENSEVDLVLIGRDGETSSMTRALIKELGLTERVHILENLPHAQTLDLMAGAQAFVLASRIESFAICLLEAGALSLPVVATDICGVGELLDDHETGRLVPTEEPAELARVMLEVAQDPAQRQRLGAALRRHVEQQFSWSLAARRYIELAAGQKAT